MRVRGKWCVSAVLMVKADVLGSTTDHISAAGAWLKVNL
jgi:hypothetical protein